MRHLNGIVVAAVLAVVGCARQAEPRSSASSSTVLTAAEVRAQTQPSQLTVPLQPHIDTDAPLELWRERYPQAARVLDEWVARYPDAAAPVMAWSVDEPDQLEVLVLWAVTSPHESLQTFLTSRTSWRTLAALQHGHPQALDAFTHWVRSARPAAEELALRPGGLAVVANGNTKRR
jgi:hypothetical protein